MVFYEDENVLVKLLEVECEYMYSNPTGMFNLSMTDKNFRTKNWKYMSYQQFKEYQQAANSV